MAEGAFTSDLSVPDFAACLQMGLEPVGFVQGSCVVQWRWYGYLGYGYSGYGGPFGAVASGWSPPGGVRGYEQRYRCPHGFVSAEHRLWGQNIEQPWVEEAWRNGYGAACARMVEEARAAGADGIVGVVDSWDPLTDMGVLEFRVRGTAVRLDGAGAGSASHRGGAEGGPEGVPWTTYLAGQRLAKLVEAGYAPVGVVAAVASVRVWASCMTQYLAGGSLALWGGATSSTEISQVADAQMAVRQLAREHARAELGPDSLHGASLLTESAEIGEGDADLRCVLRGNRVRRIRRLEPLPRPRPVVRLG